MVPSLAAIRDVWATTTDHDSAWSKAVTLAGTVVLGWAITWRVVGAWERRFGYSSLVAYVTGLLVLLSVYVCLSYVSTRIADRVGGDDP